MTNTVADYINTPIILAMGYSADPELEEAGAMPLSKHVGKVSDLEEVFTFGIDGVVFLGGGDVNPAKYGKTDIHADVYGIDRERDLVESTLIKWCIDNDVPMMGICRGAQLINVMHGGTLHQDLPSIGVHGHWGGQHGIKLASESRLCQGIGESTIRGASYHHQAIRRVGEGLIEIGWDSIDGTIEAIESDPDRNTYILGVQFHPEMDASWKKSSQEIFNHFVEQVARVRGLDGFERRHPVFKQSYRYASDGWNSKGESRGYGEWWHLQDDSCEYDDWSTRNPKDAITETIDRELGYRVCDHGKTMDDDCPECEDIFTCEHGWIVYDCDRCAHNKDRKPSSIVVAGEVNKQQAFELVHKITDRMDTPKKKRKSGAQRRKVARLRGQHHAARMNCCQACDLILRG